MGTAGRRCAVIAVSMTAGPSNWSEDNLYAISIKIRAKREILEPYQGCGSERT